MSYDLYLRDPVTGETLHSLTPHHMTGGTYAIGGTTELWLNITFNYGEFYRKPDVFGEKGIKGLEGISGADSIPMIENAIAHLGDDVDPNYWTATEGNAKKPLYMLLALAKMRPDGIWHVSY